jgi:hypothetical protein
MIICHLRICFIADDRTTPAIACAVATAAFTPQAENTCSTLNTARK